MSDTATQHDSESPLVNRVVPDAPSPLTTGESGSQALAALGKLTQALASADTVDEALDIRSAAETVRQHLKKIRRSLKEQNQACELKLQAERKVGQFLATRPVSRGRQQKWSHRATNQANGRTMRPFKSSGSDTTTVSLPELGITKSESSRWQAEASVPELIFQQYVQEALAKGMELTTSGLLKIAHTLKVQNTRERAQVTTGPDIAASLGELIDSGTTFGTLYADPPWQYDNQVSRGAAVNHYPTLSLPELCQLPVAHVAATNSHLHLWVPTPLLFAAQELLLAWGFEYKSMCVWVKPELGLGNYWRMSHECCLLGVRGKCPFAERDFLSWFESPRLKHSEKPEAMRTRIMTVSPAPYLELFARQTSPGWTVLGNQVSQPTLPHHEPRAHLEALLPEHLT